MAELIRINLLSPLVLATPSAPGIHIALAIGVLKASRTVEGG